MAQRQLSINETQAAVSRQDHRLLLDRINKASFDEASRAFVVKVFASGVFWQSYTDAKIMALADIQRAARYLYLQRTAFGSRIRGRNFGTSTTGAPELNLFTLQGLLEDAWIRLGHVMIECLDFRDLIPRYDREHTLFFLDPTYWDFKCYNHNFVEQDFHNLASVLGDIKGRFLMTINDTPEVREIFKQFTIEEIELKYSMNRVE